MVKVQKLCSKAKASTCCERFVCNIWIPAQTCTDVFETLWKNKNWRCYFMRYSHKLTWGLEKKIAVRRTYYSWVWAMSVIPAICHWKCSGKGSLATSGNNNPQCAVDSNLCNSVDFTPLFVIFMCISFFKLLLNTFSKIHLHLTYFTIFCSV